MLSCGSPGVPHSRMDIVHSFVVGRLARTTTVLPRGCTNNCPGRGKHVAGCTYLSLGTETTLCFKSCTLTRSATGRIVSGKNFSLFGVSSLSSTRGGRTRRVDLCVSFTRGKVSGSRFIGNVFGCRTL